jgi:opacity protein-like surface antigen
MNWKFTYLILIILGLQISLFSQEDDLMDMFADEEPTIEYADATFKTTILVIGQTIENPLNGTLLFNVQHRFGPVNSGWYDFFGLDQANTRIGFQYGITDWLGIGIGRSSYQKTYDGWVKVKILRQSKGLRKMPLSIDYFGSMGISALKWPEPDRTNYFSSRLSYANLILIARKFSPGVSLQLMPAHVHYNLVETKADDNDVFSIGAGGRFKVSKRISINLEYYYILSAQTRKQFTDPFSIGIDIETGGHVFQLYATNAEGIIEQHFIARTSGDWLNGDIHIGFNISRAFTIKKPKEFRK